MPIPKPTPKEITVLPAPLAQNGLRITTSSARAAEWVEREAPEFGSLYPPTKERLGAYLLSVADVWDVHEVQAYLVSYGAAATSEEAL